MNSSEKINFTKALQQPGKETRSKFRQPTTALKTLYAPRLHTYTECMKQIYQTVSAYALGTQLQ